MKKSSMLRNALMGSLLLLSLGARAADGGMHGANHDPEAAARCQADPVKCEEIKKRIAERREECQKDPVACKQRHEEARQKMKAYCQDNPEKCKEMKARHASKSKSPTPASAPTQTPPPAAAPAAAPEGMTP